MAHKNEFVSTENGFKVVNSGTETIVINQDGTLNGGSVIDDGSITLAKLATIVSPSHIVKFAANYTTTGGAAAEAITLTGATTDDIVFVTLQDGGTNTVTIASSVVTANTLTVTFSADPGADAIISYQLLRATA